MKEEGILGEMFGSKFVIELNESARIDTGNDGPISFLRHCAIFAIKGIIHQFTMLWGAFIIAKLLPQPSFNPRRRKCNNEGQSVTTKVRV